MTKYDFNYEDLDNYDFYKTDKGTLLAMDNKPDYERNEYNYQDLVNFDENVLVWTSDEDNNNAILSLLKDRYQVLDRKSRLTVLGILGFEQDEVGTDTGIYIDFDDCLDNLFMYNIQTQDIKNLFTVYDKNDKKYMYDCINGYDYTENTLVIAKIEKDNSKEKEYSLLRSSLFGNWRDIYEFDDDNQDLASIDSIDIFEAEPIQFMKEQYQAKPVELNVKTTVEF